MVRQKLRRTAVGGDHEFLNELARAVLHLLAQVDHALALEHGTRLKGFQVQRARGMPALAHALGHGVLRAQLRLHAGHGARGLGQVTRSLDPRGHGVVGQLGLVAHPGTVHRRVGDDTCAIDHHLGHGGKALLVGVERGQVGGQALGQHRKHARRGVNRGGVGVRMPINGRAFFDQRIHGHPDLHRTPFQRLASRELVQVARVIVVNRTPRQCREIEDARVRFVAGLGDQRQLLQHAGPELRFQPSLRHGVDGDAYQIAAVVAGDGVHCVM